MKPLAIAGLFLAILGAAGCRDHRVVKIAWDPPSVMPDHYRVLIDGKESSTFPPPPIEAHCKCMVAEVAVDGGGHAVRVEACDRSNLCSSSAEVRIP